MKASSSIRSRVWARWHQRSSRPDGRQFDGLYFFNPFLELIEPLQFAIDDAVPMSPTRHGEYVSAARSRLIEARPGTRVVTYGGFGGEMPEGFICQLEESCYRDVLTLWIKSR